jgi:hypothetical protein
MRTFIQPNLSGLSSKARKTMVGNGGGGSQTHAKNKAGALAYSYTVAGCANSAGMPCGVSVSVVDARIKPYSEQEAERARRDEQRRVYRRNQVFGLLIVAAAILAWWLVHTNPKWIFPPGWWRP